MLTDLKARGVDDILIACTDNLTGFTKVIAQVFPQTITQLCVVHQIRNSCKYVSWKERKEFSADLKQIYGAVNKDAARAALDAFTQKWGSKYGYAITSWENNWYALTSYFDFPLKIRRIIYTTNVIESLNSGISKFTKSKNLFPDDQAAIKAVYLSIMNIQKNGPCQSGTGAGLSTSLVLYLKTDVGFNRNRFGRLHKFFTGSSCDYSVLASIALER